jgi:hypothetical protein
MSDIALVCLEKWFESDQFESYRGLKAKQLLVIADFCGDYGGWEHKIRELTQKTHFAITCIPFPSGITKWSNVKHQFYSFVGEDGRFFRAAVIMRLIGPGEKTGVTVDYFTENGGIKEEAGDGGSSLSPVEEDIRKGHSYTYIPEEWFRSETETSEQYGER